MGNAASKVVLTGAAGLVGQNLLLLLRHQGYENIVAIDKNEPNLALLARLNPGVRTVLADLSETGEWEEELRGCDCLVALHSQITGLREEVFERNNVLATEHLLAAIRKHGVGFFVHVSTSAVKSVAKDLYSDSKRKQERLVRESGLSHCVLRPTLMFGWFDPKHLGWLSRLMERVPVFPIPGDGRFMRQPLYIRDFCRVIVWCMEHRPEGREYDIVGNEEVDYVDIIRTIKEVKELRTRLLFIPYRLFALLMRIYAVFSARPPFTVQQLEALNAKDVFSGVDLEAEFGIRPTPFREAIEETFCDPRFARISVTRTN